jgi:hypothetical protein
MLPLDSKYVPIVVLDIDRLEERGKLMGGAGKSKMRKYWRDTKVS